MIYNIAMVDSEGIKKHTFEKFSELRDFMQKILKDFKEKNRVIDENKDKSYIRFKESLDEIMEKQLTKCNKCSEEDHEGIFCRCESRNIDIAKELRYRKESAWQKRKIEGLENSKEYKEASEIKKNEFKLALHLRHQLVK